MAEIVPATPVHEHLGISVRQPSPLQELHDDRLGSARVRLLLKRDDLIHPDMPGNKWRKLQYNLQAALDSGARTLLTFGGAYSNHIRATAAAGALIGLSTIGVIRGEEHLPLNPSLASAVDHGMQLTYLDRATYRMKTDEYVLKRLRGRYGDFYLLPEGGSNALAVRGCAELPAEISEPFDLICCPCGTGGTLAGIAGGLSGAAQAMGFSVLRGGEFLNAEVRRLQDDCFGSTTDNWTIELGYHAGGFAKRSTELDQFIDDFETRHGLRLDWVYTAKMMAGIFDLAQRGHFPRGSSVVAVITG